MFESLDLDFGFDTEYMNDDEIENILLEEIKPFVQKAIDEQNEPSILNPNRVKELAISYNILESIVVGDNVKISYVLHKPFTSMGYIRITGNNISFPNIKAFLKAVSLASNFELLPKTTGEIEMNFTFHEITKSIKMEDKVD